MKRLTVRIEMDNDAFNDGADGLFETARILEELAHNLGNNFGPLLDANGNKVGRAELLRSREPLPVCGANAPSNLHAAGPSGTCEERPA